MSDKKKKLVAMDDNMFVNILKTESGREILKEIISGTIEEEVEEMVFLYPEVEPNENVSGKTVEFYVKTPTKDMFIEVNYIDSDFTRTVIFWEFIDKHNCILSVNGKRRLMDKYYEINLVNEKKTGPMEGGYVMACDEDGEIHPAFRNLKIYEYDIGRIYEMRNNEDISDKFKYLAAMKCNSEELAILGKDNEKIMKFKEELDKILSDEDYIKWLAEEEEKEE